ncbi:MULTISPECIES: aminotransferase class I/II-fold pyridoxal phosphate-dependent enzyme [Lacticaseibacillus]|uniref:Aminotransferase n=2 Tax=Lacticaseibacillus TaxID=2759736 RepID=A0AAN1KES4_LACCA|nr:MULTISPECIES: aminotransferase class I/II-fold pyridoxal phosphate-dependent enzyme [Lacticaseibacillus]ARY92108.1 aromatic amino acid aminotransferase [Lacticaseibacillus casei]KAB1971159.1 aminotransferase class I/II-fold pyridoxal phosphate-dependent enzyme [Lacticaseibacillus casei]WLV80015.1 aminotransferase class I/II-fold pyridoxal phosphate-dependent enzyme [Lacticaseibacillus sp. NCIMB 15473]WNX23975.1 aminotransferase class I/II-fold pyridoxal phosphate-dependent enzyme [Lacticasei
MALVDRMNQEVRQLKPSDILQFNAEISKIDGIVKLTLGEPDFPTPEHVKAAGIRSIENNESHYTQSKGLPGLRAAASHYLATKYHTKYDPETQILITAGATGGIYSSLTAMLNKGDTVIIPTPIFPLYIPIVMLNGAKPIFIDTSADGFILKPEKLQTAIEANKDTVKAVVLNYPTNPTGVTYSRADLEALAAVIKQYEIFVLSDEIYSELTYTGTHVSLGEVLPDQAIVLNGVSKSHAMTGWRVGITAGPADVIAQVGKVSEFTMTSVTTNAQRAAEEALKNGMDDAQPMKEAYMKRRDFLIKALTDAGLKVPHPDGAFYIFAKLPERMHDSWKFVYALAREAKVAVIPGASFGPGGEGYVRISYAASMADLKLATDRIAKYMANH